MTSRRTFLGTAAALVASPALASAKPIWYVEDVADVAGDAEHTALRLVREGSITPQGGVSYVRLLLANCKLLSDPANDEHGIAYTQMHMAMWSGSWHVQEKGWLKQSGLIGVARQHAIRIASRLLDLGVSLEHPEFTQPSTDELLREAHLALRSA